MDVREFLGRDAASCDAEMNGVAGNDMHPRMPHVLTERAPGEGAALEFRCGTKTGNAGARVPIRLPIFVWAK
jgi:hypothetical protein